MSKVVKDIFADVYFSHEKAKLRNKNRRNETRQKKEERVEMARSRIGRYYLKDTESVYERRPVTIPARERDQYEIVNVRKYVVFPDGFQCSFPTCYKRYAGKRVITPEQTVLRSFYLGERDIAPRAINYSKSKRWAKAQAAKKVRKSDEGMLLNRKSYKKTCDI